MKFAEDMIAKLQGRHKYKFSSDKSRNPWKPSKQKEHIDRDDYEECDFACRVFDKMVARCRYSCQFLQELRCQDEEIRQKESAKHKKENHQSKELKCEKCKFTTVSEDALRKHEQREYDCCYKCEKYEDAIRPIDMLPFRPSLGTFLVQLVDSSFKLVKRKTC